MAASEGDQRMMSAVLDQRRDILVVLAIGTFLSIVDPYGATRQLAYPASWLYWTTLIAVGWTAGNLASGALNRLLQGAPVWLDVTVRPVVASISVMACILVIQAFLLNLPVPLGYWPTLFLLILVISAAVAAIAFLIDRASEAADAPAASDEPARPTALLTDRLPPHLRDAAILAIASEDHYLRVHTERGDELILMRLSDALRAVAHLDGMQTHRSWWVARAAVAEANRANGKLILRLVNGLEAPVSRSFAAKVREAGWA